MICVSAIYPNTPGSRFDADYYLARHAPFADSLLRPHGLIEVRSMIGIAALDGAPPPFWVVSEMTFDSRERFNAAMAACGEALFADLPNYTDVGPVLQTSRRSAD